ncbi:dephospho-CoA kinase [Cellulosilyticum sp. I15G10I2]|uniref:dephospho-CoA kinase n=1 Tax=Cellulosilyticum sp. I15G10I2 TaxID=1892843 RepID=UPI00085C1D42|nr:dephospho-CoA kinase [Cellulosilyticum sp. I15G10I2]
MKVIGIIGGTGAGKTTVVSFIKTLKKTFIISADEIGHNILLKGHTGYHLVIKAFGPSILSSEQNILREKLGEIVFRTPEKLQLLNKIMHPLIYEEVERQIRRARREDSFDIVIIDAALLIEIGLLPLTDKVIAVYAEDETRITRIMQRQGLAKEQILERFKAQKKWEEFSHVADAVIDNSSSLQNTREQIKNLLVHL